MRVKKSNRYSIREAMMVIVMSMIKMNETVTMANKCFFFITWGLVLLKSWNDCTRRQEQRANYVGVTPIFFRTMSFFKPWHPFGSEQ